MFVAGKMFEDANEAKAWIEAQTQPDERRRWVVLQLDPGDLAAPLVGIRGLHIHTFVNDVCACGARED